MSSLRRFPHELERHILLLAIDPPTLLADDFQSRYDLLRAVSLVCIAWRTWAQAELFRTVVLPSPLHAQRFLSFVSKKKALADTVLVLRLGEGVAGQGLATAKQLRVQALLKTCCQLKELWIFKAHRIELSSLGFLANALESLFVSTSILDGPTTTTPLRIPALRQLHLHECQLSRETLDTLTPLAFPSLAALAWEDNTTPLSSPLGLYLLNPAARNSSRGPVPPYLLSPPQFPDLFALSTSSPPPAWLAKDALLLLDCWASDLTERSIPHLPSSLHVVRLNPRHNEREKMLNSLTEALRTNAEITRE